MAARAGGLPAKIFFFIRMPDCQCTLCFAERDTYLHERRQYIPLETTDSCLISNLLNLQVTTDYMFMYNGKTEEVLQFDRKGKFIRRVGRQGNGPGEYSMISELAVDDSNKELSIFQYGGDALVSRMPSSA